MALEHIQFDITCTLT